MAETVNRDPPYTYKGRAEIEHPRRSSQNDDPVLNTRRAQPKEMPHLASVAEIVNAFDYRDSPGTRRAGKVPTLTESQRLMWAKGDTYGPGPRPRAQERSAPAVRRVAFGRSVAGQRAERTVVSGNGVDR